ncbi:MAG: transglutaminase domain-containing protein [Candidatus Acetothermia bacterium]
MKNRLSVSSFMTPGVWTAVAVLLFVAISGFGPYVQPGSPNPFFVEVEAGERPGESPKEGPRLGEIARTKPELVASKVVNEPDGMVVPGDDLTVELSFRLPDDVDELKAEFYSTSPLVEGFARGEVSVEPEGNEVKLSNTLRIRAEGDAVRSLVTGQSKGLSLHGSFLVIYRVVRGGRSFYGSELAEPHVNGRVAEVVYPHFTKESARFLDDPPAAEENYYLTGDPDYAGLDEPSVRWLALRAATFTDGRFPDRPRQVAKNVYRFVLEFLRPKSGIAGRIYPGAEIAGWWEEGKIGIGDPYPKPESPESSYVTDPAGYICVEHAYLFTSLVRSLGIPAREVNVGFATHILEDRGEYRLGYYGQEAAAQVYYSGDWHLFDPFLGFRNFEEYRKNMGSYTAWFAYDPRGKERGGTDHGSEGKHRHDFRFNREGTGIPAAEESWKFIGAETEPGVFVSFTEGGGHYRLKALSDRGESTGYGENGRTSREIPGALYYPRRRLPPVEGYPSLFPDFLFLPFSKDTTYRLTVRPEGEGSRLLGGGDDGEVPTFVLTFLKKGKGEKGVLARAVNGRARAGESKTYELSADPEGGFEVLKID